MKRIEKILAITMIASILFAGCASEESSKTRENEPKETQEETAESTVETIPSVAPTKTPTPKPTLTPRPTLTPTPVPTAEPTPTEEPADVIFEGNHIKSGYFGNLTDEEIERFQGIFGGDFTTNFVMSNQADSDRKTVATGYLIGCYDRPEDVVLDFIIPFPADESHIDGEYCDPYYIPVEIIEAELYDMLGIETSKLSDNPLCVVEHDGVDCYIFDCGTGAPGAHIARFDLRGGTRTDNEYYLYFEGYGYGSEEIGFSILHIEADGDDIKVLGARYAENFEEAEGVLASNELITKDIIEEQLGHCCEYRFTDKYDAIRDYKYEILKDSYYAKAGVIFDDPFIQTYFESRDWYEGTTTMDELKAWEISDIEYENITEIEKLSVNIDAALEDYYQNEILSGNECDTETVFVQNSKLGDNGYELAGDSITGIDGIWGHLINDFDNDGFQELVVFGLVEEPWESQEYPENIIAFCDDCTTTLYRLTMDVYSYVDGEIVQTDTYTHHIYDPDGKFADYCFSICDISDTNVYFDIYEVEYDSYVSIVCSFTDGSNGLTGDGHLDAYYEFVIVDGSLEMKRAAVQSHLGSDCQDFDVYYFTDGVEDESLRESYDYLTSPYTEFIGDKCGTWIRCAIETISSSYNYDNDGKSVERQLVAKDY